MRTPENVADHRKAERTTSDGTKVGTDESGTRSPRVEAEGRDLYPRLDHIKAAMMMIMTYCVDIK